MSIGRMLTSFRLCKQSGMNQTHILREEREERVLDSSPAVLHHPAASAWQNGVWVIFGNETKLRHPSTRRQKNTQLSPSLCLFYVYIYILYIQVLCLPLYTKVIRGLGLACCHGSWISNPILGFKVASDWIDAGVWVITNNASLSERNSAMVRWGSGSKWRSFWAGVEHICPTHPQDSGRGQKERPK